MLITVKSLSHETVNFFRNNFITFLTTSLIYAFITIVLNRILAPSKEQLYLINPSNNLFENNIGLFDILNNMTIEQKQILLHVVAASSLSGLIGNSLLTGSTILLIQQISDGHKINILKNICVSLMILPKLIILIFNISILVQIGMIMLIIPGIIFLVMLIFAPILLVIDKMNVFSAMYKSAIIASDNIRLVIPVLIVWLITKILLITSSANFIILVPNISLLIINTINNLISVILLIYLFRLHMLIRY